MPPRTAGRRRRVPEALRIRLLQQEAVARLGQRALKGTDLDGLMDETVASVARTLHVSNCKILELLPDSHALLLRAGVGWTPGHVGRTHVGTGTESQAGYTLLVAEPVLVDDLATDTRFSGPLLLREHGIVSGMSVIIQGRERPYGVLGVHTTKRRTFSQDDIHFAQAVANVLAMAVERDVGDRERAGLLVRERAARAEAESLAEVGRLMNESLDLPEVAQRIADSVLELLAAEGAIVLLPDADSGDLRVLAVAGTGLRTEPGEIAFRHGTGLSGLAAKLRQPVASQDVLNDARLVYSRHMRERLSRSGIRSGLAVPLIAKGTLVGVLTLGGGQRGFDDAQIRLARAFGDEAATAVWNARLHEQLRARLTQSETLLAVSEQVTAVVDVTETMRRVARQVGLALGADTVGAFLADPDEEYLRPIAGWHVPRHLVSDFMTYAIPLKGHRILEEAWQGQAPVWLKDVGADPRVDREAFERFRHRSNLFCPMIVQGKAVGGLFATWWEVEREFMTEEVRLIEGICRQAAIALANARLVGELRGHQARLEALLEVSRGLSRIQPPSAVLTGIARACGELLGTESVGVRLIEGDDLVLAAAWGDAQQISKPRLKVGESLSGQVATTGECLIVMEPEGDPRLVPEHQARVQALGYRAWLGVPIKMGDRVAGVLSIRTKRPGGFSAEDETIAGAFASHAAVALENARLYEEVDEARHRLHAMSRRLVETQEVERRHLARELHDEIGQVLTGLKLSLETEAGGASPEIARANAGEAQRLVHGLIERVRGLSLDLRPAMLDDLGLVSALLWHLDRYTAQTKIRIHFEQSLPPSARFPSSIETATYRIVQEALTNVARHAAVAEATVRLWTTDDRVYVQIQDAGVGFDPLAAYAARESSGLAGMRERASLLGGDLSIDSALGSGVRVTAELPLVAEGERPA
jgi:GAF domain-containing protein